MRSGEQRVTVFHLRPLRTDERLAKQPRAADAIPPAQEISDGREDTSPAQVSAGGQLDPRPTAPSDEEERSGRRPPRMDRTGQLGAAALERMREPGGRDQSEGGRLLVVPSGRLRDPSGDARFA
jgi:hypothetical protein